MVFSQTSLETQSVLKVVEINRLKANQNHQVNGLSGVITDGNAGVSPPSPVATTSFSEDYLKPEPLFESIMYHESDCEYFQDLDRWCSTPAKEEQVQIIDSPKKTEDRAHNIDNTYTPFSPQGWDAIDANSSYTQAGFYNNTYMNPLSPTADGFGQLENNNLTLLNKELNTIHYQEDFVDLGSLPVVIEELTSEKMAVANHWPAGPVPRWDLTHDTDYTFNTQDSLPFIHQEDSLDSKCVSVTPREVENSNVVISEYIVCNEEGRNGQLEETGVTKRGVLSVDVTSCAPAWPAASISTPEVLSYVEQMEKEKVAPILSKPASPWPDEEALLSEFWTPNLETNKLLASVDYEPITPKTESHMESDVEDTKSHTSNKRSRDSDDSDETYTPYTEQSSRKYKRKKPSVPIKDMILALEGSQTRVKARRGRPPKRRESVVSSVCSVDDNTSTVSTQEVEYRKLRDKNNEASKRSRMNRKLKELQMEQLVLELEDKNKKLKIKADILEEMAKKMKDALMTAILKK